METVILVTKKQWNWYFVSYAKPKGFSDVMSDTMFKLADKGYESLLFKCRPLVHRKPLGYKIIDCRRFKNDLYKWIKKFRKLTSIPKHLILAMV